MIALAFVQACRFASGSAKTLAIAGLAGLLAAAGPQEDTGKLSAAQIIPTPAMSMPGYLQPAIDPAFGTPFTRVTDPGHVLMPGVVCDTTNCTHRYSSAQAWNADQSLLAITMGCSGFCFLDGHSYAPAFHRSGADECEWHPTDPAMMLCVAPSGIYTWTPRTDVKSMPYAPAGYTALQFGPYKGNPSMDGTILVVRAVNPAGAQIAFAYDLARKVKHPDIDLSKLSGTNNFCSISPSGRFVFCFQDMGDERNESYILTVDGAIVGHWTENHRPGHGDMAIDGNGDDVYVGISKSDPDKYHVIKRRLRDGLVTDLVAFGEGQHASIRNINRPGWVFLSYSGAYPKADEHPGWAPFYMEIVALRIDGSGELRRIVHTRSVKSDYRSEAHASPSPDGTQVIWASNWGEAGGPVAAYVARVTWAAPLVQDRRHAGRAGR